MQSMMFVCHGNICRSTMAEFVMKDLLQKEGISDVFVASSATSREEIGHDTHPGTKRKLTQMGIAYAPRQAVQLTRADFAQYDYLIGMDSANLRNMKRIFGIAESEKIFRLLDLTEQPRDIADPWYTGNFDETFTDIMQGCRALLKEIHQHHD